MKLAKIALVLAAGLLVASTAFAGEGKGEGLYGFQITNGVADLYSTNGNYISAYQAPEFGFAFQYWRLMTNDYAFNMSVGMGMANEKDESSVSGDPDFEYKQSSFNVRVGGDRAAKIGDRAIVYFGPGLEYWSGNSTFGDDPKSENTTRIAVSGRIGGVMMFNEKVGFNCQIGRFVGRATAEADGAKATWYTAGFEGSGGLVFRF
ncbi:MAG: hypothetical protein IPJ04_06410 [Candidatus Eisenbacteria bacterium]|nr:hypothetical protein [Candidatus Eisenbacteria bacterium]